jgi:hypothetical protein
MENIDFDKLLHDVMENPELLLDNERISNEHIIELQKKMNPYINLSDSNDPLNKQIAACSYTNLREDYIKRFTMTSFISFIFQMLHEYEVPEEKRIWKPEYKDNSNNIFDISKIKTELTSMLYIIEEIEQTKELLNEKKNKNDYKLLEKKTGLTFTIAHMLKDIGLIADSNLHTITIEANKYPDIKKIINTKYHNKKEYEERIFPNEKAKEIINNFLRYWLSFDPSIHVRSGLNKDSINTELEKINKDFDVVVDKDDPSHLSLYELKRHINPTTKEDIDIVNFIYSDKKYYNTACSIIRNEELQLAIQHMLNNKDIYKYYILPVTTNEVIIPPQDTFHRWSYYTEVNYEEIRTITETLYPEKSDLDWAIAIWKTFKGTESEINEQFINYCQKHHDELPSIIKSIEIGKWTLLADFKENRKNIQFYNKHTEVLKKIIDRHTEDKKIGSELMRNRVRQTKAKNISEYGPDAPGLKSYKATISSEGKDLVSKGVERVITPEEMKRLEKAQGNIKAAKELEIIDEYENIIKGYEDIRKYRELNSDELFKYNNAVDYLNKAKEMINVPDDAIQVDVFTNDTSTGSFNKTHFYTKCDEILSEKS